ncbi:hypothetical protein [Saccharibacillus endophyticus]|uniref:DUF3139 domain-containing protein n=1 Tax=Saccharibacillus endophyticus TaxID=2060666 RepID=A0ABQ1ZM48_9BACL|nr:hypothetical protein [Saccharibacillus endophyticus]GGH71054.1 hypothetical protein GCM10007362_07790 [Saccharibacillus endophyticus]
MSMYRRHWALLSLLGVIAIAVTISFIRYEPIRYVEAEETKASPAMAERIRTEGAEDQLLLLEDEGWTYAYYRRPEGLYERVNIQVIDSGTFYKVKAIVDYAHNEQFIDTDSLVRFKNESGKKIEIGKTEGPWDS